MIEPDTRTESRKRLDRQIAAAPPLPEADITGRPPMPLEAHLPSAHRLVAIVGIVENGVVRPLDPNVKLPERARVIIVAQDAV